MIERLADAPIGVGAHLTVSPVVVGVVLLAAVIHATWNAIAHSIKDKLVAFTLIGLGGALGSIPLIILAPVPRKESWPFLALSVVLHVAYTLLLMQSYRLGEFSKVYPLARGTSPLLVSILAAIYIGEVPGPLRICGIMAISAGLASLVFIGRRFHHQDRAAIAAAIGTGVVIAAYTTTDAVGVRLSGTAGGYAGWLILCEGMIVPLWVLIWRRQTVWPRLRGVWVIGLIGGVCSLLAYGLVLWAQTRGAIGPIAAIRESGIVFGAIIGTVIFHESFGRSRILATILVASGIVVLATGQ